MGGGSRCTDELEVGILQRWWSGCRLPHPDVFVKEGCCLAVNHR